MQEEPSAPPVPCPVCGNSDTKPIYPKSLGMPYAKQMLIGYRCCEGHTFLPPSQTPT